MIMASYSIGQRRVMMSKVYEYYKQFMDDNEPQHPDEMKTIKKTSKIRKDSNDKRICTRIK